MRSLRFAFAFSQVFLITAALRAQDTQPVNIEAILRDLNAIEKQRTQLVLTAKQAAIAKLQQAGASGGAAVGFYTDAVEAVEYEGKPNKVVAFNDWKSANSDLLRSHELQSILLLHLKYLVLSLQRGDAEDPEPFLTPALNYAKEIFEADAGFLKEAQRLDQITNNKQASPRDREDQGVLQKILAAKALLLDRSLTESVFTKWMRMESWLPLPAKWELIPGNLSGILEKDLRPTLRLQKNPQLMDSWTFEMQFLANRAASGKLEQVAGDFDTVVRPRMIFSRANDLVLLGWNNRAISDIYGLLKTYPTHPDFDKWVPRLRELLELAAAPPMEVPTPPPGLTPEPSPTASAASAVPSVPAIPAGTTPPSGVRTSP